MLIKQKVGFFKSKPVVFGCKFNDNFWLVIYFCSFLQIRKYNYYNKPFTRP